MKFDLCQKNRAKELLLSENQAVWPPRQGSRVKACTVTSRRLANISDGKIFLADTCCGNMSS